MRKLNHSWVKVPTFCEDKSVTPSSFYIAQKKGTLSSSLIRNERKANSDRSIWYIDVNAYARRKAFINKVWDANHTMYYFLTKQLSEIDIARLLNKFSGLPTASWQAYLSVGMWMMPSDLKVFSVKVTNQAWQVFRILRWIIRRLFHKAGVPVENRNLEVLLMRSYN